MMMMMAAMSVTDGPDDHANAMVRDAEMPFCAPTIHDNLKKNLHYMAPCVDFLVDASDVKRVSPFSLETFDA